MDEHPHVAIARNAMESFNKGDMDGFTATLADDVVWHAPGHNRFSGEFRGKEANLARFKAQAESGIHISFDDLHDVVGNDEHVVALLTFRAASGDDVVVTPSVFVMHVRDGKLVEFWAMNERQAEIDALIG